MRNNTLNMIPDGAGDMTADVTTAGIYIGQAYGAMIQAVWTGTPVGNFKLQVSADAGPNEAIVTTGAVVNWSDYPGSTQAAGGAAGNFFWDLTFSGTRWVRLVYTHGSSTGSLTIAQCSPKG